jgi:hypothetical protein
MGTDSITEVRVRIFFFGSQFRKALVVGKLKFSLTFCELAQEKKIPERLN